MKTCGQCRHYLTGKQSCSWRPVGMQPMWMARDFANGFNPWISPTADASRCETFEEREEKANG